MACFASYYVLKKVGRFSLSLEYRLQWRRFFRCKSGGSKLSCAFCGLNHKRYSQSVPFKVTATLIDPFWPSSQFWTVISRKFSRFIVEFKWSSVAALEQGRSINSLLGSDRFTGLILAFRMEFCYFRLLGNHFFTVSALFHGYQIFS